MLALALLELARKHFENQLAAFAAARSGHKIK
jgi:hypothetical protein